MAAKPEQLALPGLRLHIIYVLVPRSHRRDRSDEHLLGFGVGDDGLQVSNQLFERGDRSPQTCLGDEVDLHDPAFGERTLGHQRCADDAVLVTGRHDAVEIERQNNKGFSLVAGVGFDHHR